MSAKIDALIRSAQADRTLTDQLRNAGGLDRLVQIGAERGYHFTRDEIEAYLDQFSSEELSEQELELAAGGTSNPTGDGPKCYLQYKLDRCFVKSWSTSGASE